MNAIAATMSVDVFPSRCFNNTLLLCQRPYRRCFSSQSSSAGPLQYSGGKIRAEVDNGLLCFEGTTERIRKLFDKVQLSVSAYDTAWVALVPSSKSSDVPYFPECVDWLLDSQLSDGSWGLPHHRPLLIKDALSSTLASILALKRWNVGEEQINKGLNFIELNRTSTIDENQYSPIGFDIIFAGMVEYAEVLDLDLPFKPNHLDTILFRRKLELKRCHSEGQESYLAYISEGMGKLQDWERVMKYQRKNGSLFNSPSTTAAAFMHLQDAGCLNYLCSLLEKFGNAVPTVYPLDMYARLCLVDSLVRLGIERHFRQEIASVLDGTYRCWMQGDEEIFRDTTTCAMAFRLLRISGYDVSSDPLTTTWEGRHDYDFHGGQLKDIGACLELYKASQLIVHPDESVLQEIQSWCGHFLEEKLHNIGTSHSDIHKYVRQEVNNTLKFPFHEDLERMEHKRSIENYNVDSTSILKTSYCLSTIKNEDILKVAVEDFNICQSIQLEELKNFERWFVENRLDKLKLETQKPAYCYFTGAAKLFSPELSDARMSWAKGALLTAVSDDFYDFDGSIEELENLTELIDKWDVDVTVDCCSEKVEILFSAIHSTVRGFGAKAITHQGRNVTTNIRQIWSNLLNSMLVEAKWARDKLVPPTMEEYMTNGFTSFALGPIVLPALFFVGPTLSEEIFSSCECQNLFRLMSTTGRLINDSRGYERESRDGKWTFVPLRIANSNGAVTAEDVLREVQSLVVDQRRELLGLVLQKNGSLLPRPCKDLFWNMSTVLHLFYKKDDGFHSRELLNTVKAIIYEPIAL